MKNCLYLTSALSAGFFCWAIASVNLAFGAEEMVTHGGHAAVHHGGHEASSSGLPQLDVTTFPSQLFWLVIAFVFLYFIFSRKSLPEISNVLENRQQHIESDLESAEQLKAEAENVQKAYEESLAGAREKATKAMQSVQEKIKLRAEKENNEFRAKVETDMLTLEKNIQSAKETALDEMNMIAAEVASEAAKKIVGLNPDIEQAKSVVESLGGNKKAKAA